MELMKKRLSNLLSVKSLVTLVLTVVFAYMAVTEKISQDFMTVYAVVIAFYFGTQSQKVQDAVDGEQKRKRLNLRPVTLCLLLRHGKSE